MLNRAEIIGRVGKSNGKSKWQDFEIAPEELKPFFDNYRQ